MIQHRLLQVRLNYLQGRIFQISTKSLSQEKTSQLESMSQKIDIKYQSCDTGRPYIIGNHLNIGPHSEEESTSDTDPSKIVRITYTETGSDCEAIGSELISALEDVRQAIDIYCSIYVLPKQTCSE